MRGAGRSEDSKEDIGTYVAQSIAGLRGGTASLRDPFRKTMTERRTSPWIAFLAGAVAMLALALAWYAWRGGEDAGRAADAAVRAADGLPAIERPRLPDAPRIPDVPIPVPK